MSHCVSFDGESIYVKTLSGDALIDAAEGRSINVSGVSIAIADLARAGWTCRIKGNSYAVGTTRTTHVTFNGSDKKSHITFSVKTNSREYILQTKELFGKISSSETGIISVFPKSVAAEKTDMEALEYVERRIRSRLKSKKYQPRRVWKQLVPAESEPELLTWPMEFTRSGIRAELALPAKI